MKNHNPFDEFHSLLSDLPSHQISQFLSEAIEVLKLHKETSSTELPSAKAGWTPTHTTPQDHIWEPFNSPRLPGNHPEVRVTREPVRMPNKKELRQLYSRIAELGSGPIADLKPKLEIDLDPLERKENPDRDPDSS